MSTEDLVSSIEWYVCKQLDNLFPLQFGNSVVPRESLLCAIERTNFCISKGKVNSNTPFNYLNSGQYATFLYYLSRELWVVHNSIRDATRIFLLNKALNGVDLFYEVEMPKVFLIGHTVGMVFAKATYGENLIFHQGCTVGRNRDERPIIEDGVILYPYSSIIGKCYIKENTVLSPGIQLINTSTPGNCIVFRNQQGAIVFKEIEEYYADRYLVRD